MKKKITVVSISLLLVVVLISFIPFEEALVFYDQENEQIQSYVPTEDLENQTFAIQYTHSIHLTPVIETYERAPNGRIRQIELQYENFAVGMPAHSEGDEVFIEENGKYYIKNMNRIFPSISMRVGQVKASHHLVLDDKSMPFSAFMEEGGLVKIEFKKINILDKWRGVNIHEGF
ncbi:MAG: DUF1850 domain-containing protein [Bacillus sp. (in: firmicutes)]